MKNEKTYSGRPCPFSVRNSRTGEFITDIKASLGGSGAEGAAARFPTMRAAEGAALWCSEVTGSDWKAVDNAPVDQKAKKPSAWRTDFPDADIEVLVRLDNEEFHLGVACYDGEKWMECDQEMCCAVRGWMHLEDAARILDAATC